jgi:hypothetical protein
MMVEAVQMYQLLIIVLVNGQDGFITKRIVAAWGMSNPFAKSTIFLSSLQLCFAWIIIKTQLDRLAVVECRTLIRPSIMVPLSDSVA